MTLGTAAALLLCAAAGLAASCILLRGKKTLRIVCTAVCVMLVLALAVYIGLTLLFVDAVRQQPPALP